MLAGLKAVAAAAGTSAGAAGSSAGAPREIWCSGPILEAVQSARLFPDSKTFVDSPLLVPPDECWHRWDALPQPVPRDALAAFVEATFGPPGHDLVEWTPPDHNQSPALLARLPAGTVQDWAAALNNLWPVLGRRLSEATLAHPERTTQRASSRPEAEEPPA